jgi:disulfide bond formation protein DsbB
MIRVAALLNLIGAALVVIGARLGDLAWIYAAIVAAIMALLALAIGVVRTGRPAVRSEPPPATDRTDRSSQDPDEPGG